MATTQLNQLCSKGSSSLRAKDVVNDGPYPVYGASGIIGSSGSFQFEEPYVAIVKDGAGVGRACVCEAQSSILGTMQALIPNQDTDFSYLSHLASSLHLEAYASGATIPHIYFKDYGKHLVKELDFDQQRVVAARLDEPKRLIGLLRVKQEKLDELVKSRFIEMFGDPEVNGKSFEQASGRELFKIGNGRARPVEERFEEGIPAYGGNGISWYTNDFLVDFDTIIIGRVGRHCGNTRLVKEPAWVTDNAMYIKDFKRSSFDLVFLSWLMNIVDFNKYADKGDLWKISQKPFMEYQYYVPPLELQRQFADFVAKVDKLKAQTQQSIDKLQMLYDSLAQEYFGGDCV